MECRYCSKEVKDEYSMVIEPPDGDCYHKECYEKHKKDREVFFNNIGDDGWYSNWCNEFMDIK